MPDERADEQEGLFGSVFSRGGADVGDTAWLRAMLAVEAALARATERAGLAPAGSGTEVTRAAAAGFDTAELGRLATLTGNPVPGLARTPAPCTAVRAARTSSTPPRCC
jgi:hypothetical protein